MDVAVVILNWNGKAMLERYLTGVVESAAAFGGGESGDAAFVVVADNGSTDGSQAWMEENHPGVRLLEFDRNYGFSGGYNRALQQVEADYYILLNSDVDTPKGWIDPLLEFMEENPEAGICQPKILSEADHGRFEYAGAAGGFIDRYGYPFCRGRILSNIEKDCGQYDEPLEVFWASGACMMIRSALYHHLGGLDESFFAHMEEIDLCWRARLLGYQVWCIPTSAVYHVGGGTLPNDSPHKLYLNFRNNLLMLWKNLPSEDHRRIRTRMAMDRASALLYLLTGRWKSFSAVHRAHRDYRKMREDLEESPFEAGRDFEGYYPRSIVFDFFRSRKRLKFSDLDF